MIATPQIQKLDSEPESDKLKEDRNKIFKVKVNFLGLLSVEQEIKDDEVNRERKLQIDIAKLQTDVQNYLAITLAFIALTGVFIVAEAQNPLSYQGFIFAGIAILFGVYAWKSVKKAQSFRNQMDDLT